MTFNDLKLSAPLLKAVSEAGYETPSPIQASAIPPVLEGRDLMGCAQTGTGKTAAFALPMLDRLSAAAPRKKGAVRALILTPTRELALQIGESFDAYGKYLKLRSTVIFGGVGQAPQVEALKKAVGSLTGVTPDFYVLVEWEAVGELVDAIGGVYFDVPRRMYYNDLSQHFKIDLQPGYQLLDGNGAMGVLRWRHNSDDSGHILNSGYAMGDLGRIETQQAFLKEVVRKCLQPDVLLSNLMDYISIFQKNVTTDLSVGNLAYFGKSAIGKLDMDSVEFVTLPNQSAGDAHLLPVGSQIVEMVNEGFNPYQSDISLRDLNLKRGLLLAGIVRQNGQIVIPSGNDVLHLHDDVIVVTTDTQLEDLRDILAE